jgi:hypothetical protein
MVRPILSAVIKKCRAGILKTATERWVDCLILLALALNAVFGNHANFWDAITPIVWVVCLIAAVHVVWASIQVWREEDNRVLHENESIIFLPNNQRARFASPPCHYLSVKLFAIVLFSLLLLAIPSYLVKYMAILKATPVQVPDPLFATVETEAVTFPGGYFTGFWHFSEIGQLCTIDPIEELAFIRIVNNSNIPILVTGYTVELGSRNAEKWQFLEPIDLRFGAVLYTSSGDKPPRLIINMASGETGKALFVASPAEVNYKLAAVVQLDSLDTQLASGNSIPPNMPVRGWAAFKVNQNDAGWDIRITINDGLNQKHQFIVPQGKKNSYGSDVILRLLKLGGEIMDVSGCEKRVRLPVPPSIHHPTTQR